MEITMRPKGKVTGNSYKIVSEALTSGKVSMNNDGELSIRINIGPINTSGNFRGDLKLSISELHQIVGMAEEMKFKKIMEK